MTDHKADTVLVGQKQTILVVEDEILIRLFICAYLRDCGFRVIEAANGDEALVALREPGIVVDIIMSDVEMPGAIDGFALARWVREHRPGLPIILVGSAARATAAAADLCESGPMSAKPYEPAILLEQIRRTLAERTSSS